MIRDTIGHAADHDPHFEWRGQDVTRIENLSDIVFAIAFGMLVMSGDAPRTFEELNQFLRTLVPVVFGFLVMFAIWNGHYTFFRRYALADKRVVFINSVLLLLVLVIAYPLRFIFDSLYGYVLLVLGDATLVTEQQIDFRRAGIIMGYFTAGFALTELLLAWLYGHALSRADGIVLNKAERALTRQRVWLYVTGALWSMLACALAVLTPLGGFAGFFMNATVVTSPIVKRLTNPKELSAPSSPPRQMPEASTERGPDSSRVPPRVQ